MKATLLTFLIAVMTLGLQAQVNRIHNPNNAKKHPALLHRTELLPTQAGLENPGAELLVPINPTVASENIGSPEEILLGKTIYDLQTNNSVQNRVLYGATQGLSTVWTFGAQQPPSFPDRGTAYQQRSNTGELLNPDYVTNISAISRIENLRSGFASLSRLPNGSEFIVSHFTAPGYGLTLAKNNPAGSNNWTQNTILASIPKLWPRAIAGGPDGNSIHVIAVTLPTALDGAEFQGLDGALVYSRSTDGGNTWNMVDQILPGMDSTFYRSFAGDEYAIDTKGDIVAFVYGSFRKDWVLMKSTDNGSTWTKRIILPFPIDRFEDQLLDTTDVVDGSMALTIDNQGRVHTFGGYNRVFNSDTTDGSINYFPGRSGIMYWNENFEEGELPVIIADLVDEDGNGQFDISIAPNGVNAPYTKSATSFPSVSINPNDNSLWLTYAGIREGFDYMSRGYRHIYSVYSTDGGSTWSDPVDITPFDDYTEYIYGCQPKFSDNKMRIVYQRDFLPGIAAVPTTGNYHEFTNNDIVYLELDKEFIINTAISKNVSPQAALLFPNPAHKETFLRWDLAKAGMLYYEMVDIAGRIVFNKSVMYDGLSALPIDCSRLHSGFYLLRFVQGNQSSSVRLVIK